MALSKDDNPPEHSPGYANSGSHPQDTIRLHTQGAISATNPATGSSQCSAGWFAVQTRPRAEKALAWHCINNQIPYFLPMRRTVASSPENRARSTRNAAYAPLLPGIMFAAGNITDSATVVAGMSPSERNGSDSGALQDLYRAAFAETEDLLRKSRHVFGFLHTKRQERLSEELLFLASENPDERTLRAESSLPIGCPVVVRSGPFQNLNGILTELPRLIPDGRSGSPNLNGRGGSLGPSGRGSYSQENAAPPRIRLTVLLHLFGKPVSVEIDRHLVEAL